MAIDFACSCGDRYSYPNSGAGTVGRCDSCKAVLRVPMPTSLPGKPPGAVTSRDAASVELARPKPTAKVRSRYGNGLERGRNVFIALVMLALGTIGFLSAYSIYKDEQKIASKGPTSGNLPIVPKRSSLSPGQFSAAPGSLAKLAAIPAPLPSSSMPKLVVEPDPAAVTSLAAPPEPKAMTPDQILAKLEPSVAVIRGFETQGMGFVVAPGLVATNAHLIRRSLPTAIKVSFPAGPAGRQGPFPVEVLYFDEGRDLAILGVPAPTPPIPVATDYLLRRGEDVVYMGGPSLDGKAARCVVSRGMLGADVRVDDRDYYELSGPVTPTHSGAPVIDTLGRVVAVLTSKGPGEGTALCIPAAHLADALEVVSASDPARVAATKRRHEASVRLASAVVRNGGGIAVEGRGDKALGDFLKRTEPATWLASVDAGAYCTDSNSAVAPVRDRFKRAKAFYAEGEKSFAASTIQFVGQVRDAGMTASCTSFLEGAMTWAPEAVLKASKTRSIQAFGEVYVGLRVNDRLGHAEALARMRDDPSSLPPGLIGPAPAASKTNGPDLATARLEAAQRLANEGKTEAAIAAFRALMEDFPRTPQSGIAQARINVLTPKKKPAPDPNAGKTVPRG